MNIPIRRLAYILLATLAMSGAATGQEWIPVTETHPSHLGITVTAPGTEGWVVAEERTKKGWRILYRNAKSTEESRTRGVFLKSDQYKPGKFAKEHGSLEALAQTVFKETRTPGDNKFTEKWAEVARADGHGFEALRIRIAWEERNNPNFPGAVFLMENVQTLMLHPRDPDRVISIVASTRRRIEQEPLSADEFSAAFVGALQFE
jgi:hypothetical protein